MTHLNRAAKASTYGLALLLILSATPTAFAQSSTSSSLSTPLVYSMENTGAAFPPPLFPSFAQLPIVRPLPDPFVFFSDGHRDTSFASWEQRRQA